MPQYNSYTLINALDPADIILVWQDASGANKTITFENFAALINESSQTGPRLLASQYTSVVAASSTSVDLLTGNYRGNFLVPADSLVVGSVFRARIQGFLSTKSGYDQTGNIQVKIGGVTINANLPVAIPAAIVSKGFVFEVVGVVRSTGALGTIITQGLFTINGTTYQLNKGSATTAVDTTQDNAISATMVWSLADASNSLTATSAIFEIL